MAEIIDQAAIEQLQQMMGDDFSLLIETFINDSSQRLTMIEAAIANNDPETLRTSAHSFKGSALNLSALTLTDCCRKLETLGSQGTIDGADQLLLLLRQEFDRVKDCLSDL